MYACSIAAIGSVSPHQKKKRDYNYYDIQNGGQDAEDVVNNEESYTIIECGILFNKFQCERI